MTTTTSEGRTTLPRSVIVPLSVVSRYLPGLTRQASTGRDASAAGKPTGTRVVVYANGDGTRKVTLSVDQYGSLGDASAAYQRAVRGSQAAPGAQPAPAPNLGQQSFAGLSQVGSEKHFGLGVLDGRLIVAATYAGYPVDADSQKQLVALGSQQLAAASHALG